MKFANKIHFSSVLSLLFALVVSLVALPADAQQNWAWRVDQEHSVARLSLGAGAQSLEAGIARVHGTALFDPANPGSARFDLNIHAGEAQTSQYSEITFTSKRSWVGPDGSLLVAGDLSVTRVVRSVLLDPNEGYSGAQYGAPITHTNTSEVTLVFPKDKSAGTKDQAFQLSGSTTVDAEDFPLLRAALQSGDWPSVVIEDRQLATPPTVGEDYAGFPNTGTVIVTATNSVASGAGEGYYGSRPAIEPNTRKATIALDLRFTRSITAGSDGEPSFGK